MHCAFRYWTAKNSWKYLPAEFSNEEGLTQAVVSFPKFTLDCKVNRNIHVLVARPRLPRGSTWIQYAKLFGTTTITNANPWINYEKHCSDSTLITLSHFIMNGQFSPSGSMQSRIHGRRSNNQPGIEKKTARKTKQNTTLTACSRGGFIVDPAGLIEARSWLAKWSTRNPRKKREQRQAKKEA